MDYKKIAVIGLGDFGQSLVKTLYNEGHEVTALDRDEATINSIADHCTFAAKIDSRDVQALKSQGVQDMDTVILASAENFETLIITADHLVKMGVKDIMARYRNDLHVRVLNMLGIHNIFNPEESAALSLAERFSHKGIQKSTNVSDEYLIDEVTLPPILVGSTVEESRLRERFRISLITIKRRRALQREEWAEDEVEILGTPAPNTTFEKDDILVIFGSREDIDAFLDSDQE